MANKPEETESLRYTTVSDRKINHEGRIGYTWRFFPEEAQALDARIAKDGYTDRTSWFREVVLKLPPHVRQTAAPKKEKPAKKGSKKAAAKPSKKASKKTPGAPKKTRGSKADIGVPEEAAPKTE